MSNYIYSNSIVSNHYSYGTKFFDKEINNQTRKDNFQTEGKLKAKNSVFEKNVQARDNLTIFDVIAKGSSESLCGHFCVIDSNLQSIKGRTDSILSNARATSIKVEMGRLKWLNAQQIETSAQTIEARGDVHLEYIKVTGKVKSEMGTFISVGCNLTTIEAINQIKLFKTTCESILLKISKDLKGHITLNDSTVEGDIIIELDGNLNSSVPIDIEVKISGNGLIKGHVIFCNCEGKVSLIGEA
jgi:hypothetical protein